MIYLDTSVCLAWLLGEPRRPETEFWRQEFISSRLLEFELWNGLHRVNSDLGIQDEAQRLLDGIYLIEMTPLTLARARKNFPQPVRTLDALHLATFDYCLHTLRTDLKLASFDRRLCMAALALGLPVAERLVAAP